MSVRKSGIQRRYAYLSDLFKVIAFLIHELDSPWDLEYEEICHIEKLLKSSSHLPRRKMLTKLPNLSGYMLFVKDFTHLFDKEKKGLMTKVSELWEKADNKTKNYYKEQADIQNELLKSFPGDVQKKG